MTTGALPSSASLAGNGNGDDQMTAEREETKYLVPVHQIAELVEAIAGCLSVHQFKGRGANPRGDAQHFVTSVYFDTPSRQHYQAAARDLDDHVKVRAKEYYDLHPAAAGAPGEEARRVWHQPWIWLELKRRQGTRTLKRRFPIPKHQMREVFAGGSMDVDVLLESGRRAAMPDGPSDSRNDAAIEEIGAYCQSLSTPLFTCCLVNYRRLCWQDFGGAVRVTLDLGLECFEPPANLWTANPPMLLRDLLGAPRTPEQRAVLEIKRRAPLPSWLHEVLTRLALSPARFSKFVLAAGAVFNDGAHGKR